MAFHNPMFDLKDYKRSDDLCSISMTIPGFNNTNYGRDDKITVPGIMRVATAAEGLAFGDNVEKAILGYDWLASSDMTSFSLNFDLKVSEAVYNPYIAKSELLSDVTLVYMGKSSIKVLTQIFTKENRHVPILSYVHHIVNVHASSRKAMPWPTSMLETFKRRQLKSPQIQLSKRSEQLMRPANTFIYNAFVMWSDTDPNNHLNFASYVKYADNALRAALRYRDGENRKTTTTNSSSSASATNGNQCHRWNVSSTRNDTFVLYEGDPSLALRGISRNVVERGTKEMKIHFYKECVDDDLLQVHIWQDGVKDNIVFASVEKNNEVVAQIVLEYFSSKSKL